MKALMNNMGVFWIILLGFSLGVAAVIYYFWLKDAII
jgi:hypothetical protein